MADRPSWFLGDAEPSSYVGLDARAALDQSDRLVVASRSFVAWAPGSGFVRVRAGVTRVNPSHDIARSYPDAWRLGPVESRVCRERDGGTLALAPTASAGEDTSTLAGHFAVFDRFTEIDSMLEGHFMEKVAPGCFKKTFDAGGQKVLLQHGRDPSIGQKPIAEVDSLAEDEVGAAYRATLFPGVPELLVNGLAAGAYGASFQFRVEREEFVESPDPSPENPLGLPERTLLEVRVIEFGPCTWGAYPDATAGLAA